MLEKYESMHYASVADAKKIMGHDECVLIAKLSRKLL